MDRRRPVVGPQKSRFTPIRRTSATERSERRKLTPSIPTMDRNSMLVIEANEIVQCLDKHYVFEMKTDGSGGGGGGGGGGTVIDETTALVRVRNTQTSLICVWPLLKLKERLVKMRRLMYADESVSQGTGGDSVFFDAADVWLSESDAVTPAPTTSTTTSTTTTSRNVTAINTPTKSSQRNNSVHDPAPNQSKHGSESPTHRRSALANGHNDKRSHSNQVVRQQENRNYLGIATLSDEAALPSVSASIGFQSTQDTIRLPNGGPDQKNSNNGGSAPSGGGYHPMQHTLSSTASSELPADSEFLGMSLASTIGTSPLSPPPPPQAKDFAHNSSSNVASRRHEHRKYNGVANDSAAALPEKYLTPSSNTGSQQSANEMAGYAVTRNPVRRSPPTVAPAHQSKGQLQDQHQGHNQGPTEGHTQGRVRGQGQDNFQGQNQRHVRGQSQGQSQPQSQGHDRDQGIVQGQTHIQGQTSSPLKSDSTDSLTQQSHRPIIKDRSPNVNAAPNALKTSHLKRSRENSSAFSREIPNTSQSTEPGAVKENASVKNTTNQKVTHLGKTRALPNSNGKREQSSASYDTGKPTIGSESSPSSVDVGGTQSAVCQHCKGTSPTSRDARLQRKNKRMISSLRICRDMVKTLAYRCKGAVRNDTIADRIMYNCESIKIAVINILEAYTQAQESRNDMTVFADSELVKLTSIQLVSAMELLVSHTSLWATSLAGNDTETVKDTCSRITNTVKDLGKEMVLFLQACETDNDTLASDSSAKIIEQLYDLLKFCGALSVTTGSCPTLFVDRKVRNSIDDLLSLKHHRDDDLLNFKPSQDVKQSFLSGCDAWMCHSLESGIQTVQDCELRAQMLSEDCYASQEKGTDVAKHSYITTTTAKILLHKCQEVQTVVCSSMKEDTTKTGSYFHQYFSRCQGMVDVMTSLVDSVSLLCQATEPLIDEEDSSILKKIARCSDMVFKSTNKLVMASNFNFNSAGVLDTPRSVLSASVLSLDMRSDDLTPSDVIDSKQTDAIENCADDVKLATQALCAVIRKRLPRNEELMNTAGSKVKRMLPATPGVASGSGRAPMMRCKSAKNPERMRRSISYYDVNGKRSNEV